MSYSTLAIVALAVIGAAAQGAASNALEAMTQPYTMFSETIMTGGSTTSTVACAVKTIYASVDITNLWSAQSSRESSRSHTAASSHQSTPAMTSTPSMTTPPAESSHTTIIATFSQPTASRQESLTASVALGGTSAIPATTNNHDTLLVYDTPVIAGSPATSINGATYSLAPSGAALYVDGNSEKPPWATSHVAYSSGGGGGFVTAIASEEVGTTGTTGTSLLVGTAPLATESSVVVASATNGARFGVKGGLMPAVVVVVGAVGPFVVFV